jgi:hypothetical protein
VRIRVSRSSTAATASSTRATPYSSSSEIVSPAAACVRPSSARASAPGMPSSSSATLRASGSASSIATDRSDRAIVPGWMCIRSASRASFSACSSSRVMFRRSTKPTLHDKARLVYPMPTGSRGTRQREVAASSLKAASGNRSSLVAASPLRRSTSYERSCLLLHRGQQEQARRMVARAAAKERRADQGPLPPILCAAHKSPNLGAVAGRCLTFQWDDRIRRPSDRRTGSPIRGRSRPPGALLVAVFREAQLLPPGCVRGDPVGGGSGRRPRHREGHRGGCFCARPGGPKFGVASHRYQAHGR